MKKKWKKPKIKNIDIIVKTNSAPSGSTDGGSFQSS